MNNREIEAKFLEIDKEALIAKLKALGAQDLGEDFVKDIIFYDKELAWRQHGKKFVRIRETKKGASLTYKHEETETLSGTKEIEFEIGRPQKAREFLEEIGLVMVREQEKRRHTFRFKKVVVDIDTWPEVPTYVELEGPSGESVKEVAQELGFDWTKAAFGTAPTVIKKYYNFDIHKLRYFTFEKIE